MDGFDRNTSNALFVLTEQNYHSQAANMAYFSSTSIKEFMACESRALAKLRGEWQDEPSTALLVGSYVDASICGTLDVFTAKHPEIFTQKGTLRADYEYANYIIQRIEREPFMLDALSGEKQVIMTGSVEGIPCKIKIDSMLPDRTVDLKCMRDFDGAWDSEEGFKRPWWSAWGYQYQAALYQTIRAQNESGEVKPFCIIGATKEKPEPDIGAFQFGQSVLDAAMDEIRADIVYFDMVKRGQVEAEKCGRCAWCRSQKVLRGWEEIA